MNEEPKLRFLEAPEMLVDQWVVVIPPPDPNDPPFPNPDHNPCCDDYHMRMAWSNIDMILRELKEMNNEGLLNKRDYVIDALEEADKYMGSVLKNRQL